MRITIPVVLAFCMARPVLDWLNAAASSAPKSLVVLLDDSASSASSSGARPGFEVARTAVLRLLKALPRGSEVAVLPLCAPESPLVERTVNLNGAAEALEKAAPRGAAGLPAEALSSAAQLFSQMHHARRQVVLLSDFQKANWTPETAPAREQSLQRLHALPQPAHLSFYDTGAPATENVAVESLQFSKLPVSLKQRVRFTATLRNYGKKARPDLKVRWRVDGDAQTSSLLSLGPEESSQTFFEHTFPKTGAHWVEIELDHDGIPADDSMLACIEVREQIPVLLVNGKPSTDPLQGETDFLEIALQPSTFAGGEGAGLLQTKTIALNALDAKTLANVQVVVLANLAPLSETQLRLLEGFLEKGGGLVFFPGSRTDSAWFNTRLYREGKGLLPAAMASLKTRSQTSTGSPNSDPVSLAEATSAHPVLSPFTRAGSGLGEARIHQWYTLQVPESPAAAPGRQPPTTILSLETGEPLFLEHRFRAGLVLQSAISCTADWSNLPARPVFVPLMQRLIVHAGSAIQPTLNLSSGQTLSALLPADEAGKTLSLERPDGSRQTVFAREAKPFAVAESTDTILPGLYKLHLDSGTRFFAVNMPREESHPARLADADLETLVTQSGAALVHSPEELLSIDHRAESGREVWRPLLWATLVLLFVELWLQQRFRRKGGASA